MRKLLFSTPVTRGTLTDYFAMNNWTFAAEHEQEDDDDDEPNQITWTQSEGLHTVTFFDDYGGRLQYLSIESDGPELEYALECDIRRGPFQFWSTETALGEFDEAVSEDEVIDAFSRLAVLAPEVVHPAFMSRFERALSHESARVRSECIELLSFVSWREILPLLGRMRTDPDGTVRHHASLMSDEYRALGLG
jgi:hypothetical protein